MGLQRLYWVPDGMTADSGAYIRYPFQELLRIVALESRRHRCLVVGEDLGTVPDGFRPAMVERSEEHTSELQSLMRISYAVFCLKKNKKITNHNIAKKHISNNVQTK